VRKVLLVGKGYPDRGGIPSFLQMLVEGDLASRYRLTFLNVAHAGVPEGGEVTTGNVVRTVRDARAVFARAQGHDIVHIHSALAPTVTMLRAGLLALAARSRGCAVIVHAHGGNLETWLETPLRRRILRLSMLPAHRVVAVWSAGERVLEDVLGVGKVRLVDNGVDCSRYPDPEPPHDPPRVLYVGLLTSRKGVLDLIEASRLLTAQGVGHELRLLGGTPDEGPAAAVPVLEAARDHATLLGTRAPEEMPREYAAADVFCLPSWWEAMPLSVLEAMAAGLPVVATDVGDVSRLVTPDCGHVVPVRSPRLVAEALRPLLEDVELRRRMGAAARDRARSTFSSSATATAIGRLYDELRPESRDRREPAPPRRFGKILRGPQPRS
jgi:glycosyltransferase involved in cell wall biosynthesis